MNITMPPHILGNKMIEERFSELGIPEDPNAFVELAERERKIIGSVVVKAIMSRRFLVALYQKKDAPLRMTVNRNKLLANGRFEDGITWDELMECKRQVGYADLCMIEIYPPDSQIVDVANMRHLWLFEPDFMWKEKETT